MTSFKAGEANRCCNFKVETSDLNGETFATKADNEIPMVMKFGSNFDPSLLPGMERKSE